MKKIVSGLLLSAMALFAMPNNELELVLMTKAMQKKTVVLATMQLQGDTKEKFGNLYDEYQVKLIANRLNKLEAIAQYAANYSNMTDANADALIVKWLTVEDEATVLQRDYMAKFKTIMPSADVIRYFQIENRIQLMNELKRASLVPLAEPVAK